MPIDFTGIPTTRNREYIAENISKINEGLSDIPIVERAAILSSIIEESGGDPLAKDVSGKYQGLLQWGEDRYVPKSIDESTELNNQVQYIKSTLDNTDDGVSWTHGGKNSGYKSQREAYKKFNNEHASFNDRFKAFSYGYVRPAGKQDSYNNRLKVAKKVLNKLVVNEVLSNPKKKWVPQKFENNQYSFPMKFSEGGSLEDNYWNLLSMRDKAEMIRVAIANGITTLPEIKNAYNEFAKGGYAPSSKLQKDIATWEGSEMKRNRPFSEMTQQFNSTVPKELQDKLTTSQLDALYSYGYNVGMGNLKERVLPTLNAYTQGKASREDVQRSMWASRDNELRGLTRRRNWEREMFGGSYRTEFTGKGATKPKINLGIQIDPSSYEIPDTFFDDLNNQLYNVQMSQGNNSDVDPSTVYKPPVIDDTLFQKPEPSEEMFIYDPKQERAERMQQVNNVLGMMGMRNPLLEMAGKAAGNNGNGLMEMVGMLS